MRAQTIPALFFDQVHALGDGRVAINHKRDGAWQTWTWRAYGEAVSRTAAGLAALGVDESSRVAILARNCPEWLFADIATMCLGGAGTGIYTSDLPEQVRYIVEHSGARVLVVDTAEQLAKTEGWRDEVGALAHIVVIDPCDPALLGGKVLSWDAMLEGGAAEHARDPAAIERLARTWTPERFAMLVYTSGTTGPPKGAMCSHENLVFEARMVQDMVRIDAAETISFLPLCHVAERVQGELVNIAGGHTVTFAESIDRLRENLLEVRPTVFTAVPRLWEKFHDAIRAKFDGSKGAAKALAEATLRAGAQVAERRVRGQRIPLGLALRWAVLRRLVVAKLKKAIGLDRCRYFISGAAPLAKEVGAFFAALEVDIHEAYGQTECIGICTFNPIGSPRFGTVGRPCPGCEVRIAEDGELLTRGPNVFMGYLDDEAATRETVDAEGWLHTGDVGVLDDEGYVRIVDRKKDIIVTAGGKNVAPQNLEGGLKQVPGVSQAVVIGDRRKYCVALLTLDVGALIERVPEAAAAASSPPELVAHPEVQRYLEGHVRELNLKQASYSQIKRFAILEEELSIEGGELTPTLKVKRRVVHDKHRATIDRLYADGVLPGIVAVGTAAPAAAAAAAPAAAG